MTTKPGMAIAWAEGAAAPDIVAPDNTKLGLGWLGEDLPPHNYFNFLQNRADAYLKHLDENGIPAWDDLTTYSIGSIVKSSDTVVYYSKTNSNQNNDPAGGGDTTNWRVWVPDAADTAETVAGTVPDKYISPLTFGDRIATTGEVIAGTNPTQYVTPFTFEQGLAARDLPDLVRAPTNISPADEATGVSNPTLIGDDYGAIYGIPHESSQFKVATDDLMTSVVYDSGEISATEQHTVPGGTLSTTTEYFWFVRYKNADDVWSGYSVVTSFTTAATLTYIEQPTITYPTTGLTGVSRVPTITGSAFSVSGGADTHLSSRWEISTDAGFINVIYDTGDIGDLISHDVPSDVLLGLIEYHVRVTYTGSTLGASAPSPGIDFTTTNLLVDWANYDGSEDGPSIAGDTRYVGVQGENGLIFNWSPIANGDLKIFKQVGSSLVLISEADITGEIHGVFPRTNTVVYSPTSDSARTLRIYEDNGINYSEVVATAASSTDASVNDGEAYIQYDDSLFYTLTDGEDIMGQSLNEAGDDLISSEFDNSIQGTSMALSRDKKYLATLANPNTTNYFLEITHAGGITGESLDSHTRSGITGLNILKAGIEFFDDVHFGVFWSSSSYLGTAKTLVDIYKIVDDVITEVSVDHILNGTTQEPIQISKPLSGGLVFLRHDDFTSIISYDVDGDTVTQEVKVASGGQPREMAVVLDNEDVITDANTVDMLIQSARV